MAEEPAPPAAAGAPLRVAFLDNPRIRPLVEGAVPAAGLDLAWELGDPNVLHRRHLQQNDFDLFEFSLAAYLTVRDRPEWAHLGWTAVPVFLNKAFLVAELRVHAASGIWSLADLRGKRVGLPEFGMTAGVWLRVILRRRYGIEPSDLAWVNGRAPERRQGVVIGERPVPGVSVEELPPGQSLDDLLHSGAIDAAFGDLEAARIVDGPAIRRLFGPDEAYGLFMDFQRATGTLPINHTIVVQQHLVDADPDLPMRVYETFERSKQEAYARARFAAGGYLLFPQRAFAEQAAVVGLDPFPSGLAANRAMLTMLADQLRREGQTAGTNPVDDLFAPSTLHT